MTDVVMPQMGESIVEGTLTKWLKKPGERVERDEPLFEISTDKVDTEIPSPAAGTLSEILVEEGKTVGINTVVARIEEGGGAPRPSRKLPRPPPAPPQAARRSPRLPLRQPLQPAPAPPPVEEPAPAEPAGPLSPLVRKMARENNIDLSRVRGTGAGGRITKQDVEAYLGSQAAQPAAPVQPAAPPPPRRRRPSGCPPPPPAAPPVAPLPAAGQARDARRAAQHHAAEDRRAHGALQAHLARTSPPCTAWI